MSNAENIYFAVRAGEPKAVAYYMNLKARIADGQRAQLCLDAIRAVHERRKDDMNLKSRAPFIGAESYPPGTYLTPSGKILTPDVLAQVVAMLREAAYGGTMTTAPVEVYRLPTLSSRLSKIVPKPGGSVMASYLSNQEGLAKYMTKSRKPAGYMPKPNYGAKTLGKQPPKNTAAQRAALKAAIYRV